MYRLIVRFRDGKTKDDLINSFRQACMAYEIARRGRHAKIVILLETDSNRIIRSKAF